MGLDALVYCNCHELGDVRNRPPVRVVLEESGALVPAEDQSGAEWSQFDQWRADACAHPDGVLARERLGNAAEIATLAEELRPWRERLPVICSRILYSGAHTGDFVSVDLLMALDRELDALEHILRQDAEQGRQLVGFTQRMRALLRAASAVRKPIVF